MIIIEKDNQLVEKMLSDVQVDVGLDKLPKQII